MFGLSIGEIIFISFLMLILFGNEKLPENLKKAARGINKSKKVISDIEISWKEVQKDIHKISLNDDFSIINRNVKEINSKLKE